MHCVCWTSVLGPESAVECSASSSPTPLSLTQVVHRCQKKGDFLQRLNLTEAAVSTDGGFQTTGPSPAAQWAGPGPPDEGERSAGGRRGLLEPAGRCDHLTLVSVGMSSRAMGGSGIKE